MKLIGDFIESPFKAITTHRPWGHFGLYSDNEKCTTKILFIKKNEMLSLQYHFLRDQFYMSLDNDFIIEYSNKPLPIEIIKETNEDCRINQMEQFLKENLIVTAAQEGYMFGFKRHVIHRARYIGNREYGRMLDLAFGTNDENDITRLQDKYNRDTILKETYYGK